MATKLTQMVVLTIVGAVCGDGVRRTDLGFGQDGYEACDDGNLNAGDGSAICRFELIQVTAGYAHTCALRADGRFFCWGANDQGQLGSAVVWSEACRRLWSAQRSLISRKTRAIVC